MDGRSEFIQNRPMEYVLGGIALLVIWLIIMWFDRRKSDQAQAEFEIAAAQLGATVHRDNGILLPTLAHRVDDISVRVEWENTRVPNAAGSYTSTDYPKYVVVYPPTAPPFEIRKGKAGALSRKVDIEIGSPEFDEAFVIESSETAGIQQYLTAERQQLIVELASEYKQARITHEGLSLRSPSADKPSAHELVATVNRLVEAGRAMS